MSGYPGLIQFGGGFTVANATCARCNGSGVIASVDGEAMDCPNCDGPESPAAHGREKPREETEARLLRERGTPEERIGPVVPDGTLYPQPEPSAAKGLPEHSPPERFGPFPPMCESDDVTPVPATDADASAATPRKRLRRLTPTTIEAIEERVSLMRWSSHEEDDEITAGSLADVFWNSDIPRLIRAARKSIDA